VAATNDRPMILVVEDEPYIRDVVRWVMEDEGFSVVVAGDAAAALGLLRARRPGLVILDWMLPKGGGAAVLAGLRGLYPGTPAVVISAIDSAAEGARSQGAIAFLRKPFELEELVVVAKRAVEGRIAAAEPRLGHVA
jgi:two-component system nitrogen regulation response regulator NtrX